MGLGEGGVGGDVVFGLSQEFGGGGIAQFEHAHYLPQLVSGRFRVGLGEDGSHRGGDHLLVMFGDMGEEVAHQMHLASLPGRSLEDPGDGRLKTRVGVGDDQSHPVEAPVFEGAEEAGPEHLIL